MDEVIRQALSDLAFISATALQNDPESRFYLAKVKRDLSEALGLSAVEFEAEMGIAMQQASNTPMLAELFKQVWLEDED